MAGKWEEKEKLYIGLIRAGIVAAAFIGAYLGVRYLNSRKKEIPPTSTQLTARANEQSSGLEKDVSRR